MPPNQSSKRRMQAELADAICQVLRWATRHGATHDEKTEANQTIERLERMMREPDYNRRGLRMRDKQLIEQAVEFSARRDKDVTPDELENARRRAFTGGLVSDTPPSISSLGAYFDALGAGKPTAGRPADIARIERVAAGVRQLKIEGVPVWRQPKTGAARFNKNLALPSRVLTDGARERLAAAYSANSENTTISEKDFIKCVEKAVNVEPLL